MPVQDILALNNTYWNAWNNRDVDAIARCATEDFTAEGDVLPSPVIGRDGLREFARAYITAFPDIHFDITHQFAAGDNVITCWTATGTHKGQLMGIPPTGRWAEVHGCNVSRYHKGKLTHSLVYWDSATLLRQLGILPVRDAAPIEREVPIPRQRSTTGAEEVRL
jgi:steroid delta-isomerase-like uncharacterized protein